MHYFYTWAKESKTLNGKLNKRKLNNQKDIKTFYWERDLFNDSFKAKIYKKYHFESTRYYVKRSIQYPQYSLDFLLLLRIRCSCWHYPQVL